MRFAMCIVLLLACVMFNYFYYVKLLNYSYFIKEVLLCYKPCELFDCAATKRLLPSLSVTLLWLKLWSHFSLNFLHHFKTSVSGHPWHTTNSEVSSLTEFLRPEGLLLYLSFSITVEFCTLVHKNASQYQELPWIV